MIKEKKEKKAIQRDLLTEDGYALILYNDDVNSFDFVIETLIDVCEHEEEQAYQCALVAHHKGKCEVKRGTLDDLTPRCAIMLNKGLSVEIEWKRL